MQVNHVILCHKCAGLLTHANEEIKQAFGGCGCISGYVRDFQKALTIEEAKSEAIKHHENTIVWLTRRNASSDHASIEQTKLIIGRLNELETR